MSHPANDRITTTQSNPPMDETSNQVAQDPLAAVLIHHKEILSLSPEDVSRLSHDNTYLHQVAATLVAALAIALDSPTGDSQLKDDENKGLPDKKLSADVPTSINPSSLQSKSERFNAGGQKVVTNKSGKQVLAQDSKKLSQGQTIVLQREFQKCQRPTSTKKRELADEIGVPFATVNNWFNNKRRGNTKHYEIEVNPSPSTGSKRKAEAETETETETDATTEVKKARTEEPGTAHPSEGRNTAADPGEEEEEQIEKYNAGEPEQPENWP